VSDGRGGFKVAGQVEEVSVCGVFLVGGCLFFLFDFFRGFVTFESLSGLLLKYLEYFLE